MKKINFVNGTTINGAETFNQMQDNIEDVFNGNEPMGSIVVDDISCKNMFDEVFRQGGFNNTSASDRIYSTQNRYIKAGTYTFSTNLDISVYSFAVTVSSTPFPISGSSIDIYDSRWQTKTHTLTINQDGYLGVSIKRNDGGSIVPGDVSSYHFMFEKGSVATGYVPHKEYGKSKFIDIGYTLDSNTIVTTTIDKCKKNNNRVVISGYFNTKAEITAAQTISLLTIATENRPTIFIDSLVFSATAYGAIYIEGNDSKLQFRTLTTFPSGNKVNFSISYDIVK